MQAASSQARVPDQSQQADDNDEHVDQSTSEVLRVHQEGDCEQDALCSFSASQSSLKKHDISGCFRQLFAEEYALHTIGRKVFVQMNAHYLELTVEWVP